MRNLDKAAAPRERATAEGLDVQIERRNVCDEASLAECVGAMLDRHGPVVGRDRRAPERTPGRSTAIVVGSSSKPATVRVPRPLLPATRAISVRSSRRNGR
jgi:hypothetical protein